MTYKKEYHKKYYQAHKEKAKDATRRYTAAHKDKYKSHNLRRLYGITLEDYKRMYTLQKGRCAICSEIKEDLEVDHSHEDGKIRKLLCHGCNCALGLIKENTQTLYNMIKYIENHNEEKRTK